MSAPAPDRDVFALDELQRKHFSDVEDAAFYQYFLSLSWLPIYGLVYWGPRWL
jgi:hypothetical protein